MSKNKLYPVIYNGKEYFEKDCHPMFVAYYQSSYALRPDISVYISSDIGGIFPDGTNSDW